MVEKESKIETFKSKVYGRIKDNNLFDDIEFISQMEEVKIKEVKIFTEGKYFKGIQVFYLHGGQSVTSGHHVCETDKIEYKEDSIVLEDDEYITAVTIGSMGEIVYIKLSTNTGRSLESPGIDLLCKKVNVETVLGEQVIAFSGGYCNFDGKLVNDGFISHIAVHLGVLPKYLMEKYGIKEVEKRQLVVNEIDDSPRSGSVCSLSPPSSPKPRLRKPSFVRKLS
jgi:hypothetical protein